MSSVYSVKQILLYLKRMFSEDYLLADVSIRGEISQVKYHTSGHIYFTMKDEDAVLSCVMFAGNRRGLKTELHTGQRIVASGKFDFYVSQGKVEFYAKTIEDDGVGDFMKRFEELKKRLEETGMFDPRYKKPIPVYAMHIGIVTAETGAALQDIIRVSRERNPYVKLTLSPALVQGEKSPESLVKALKALDAIHPDVIILGRGGGSVEDLWCFNDEDLARAVFNCQTPVISAVGHEVDFSITDFVADMRAATPSQAAELAVFSVQPFLKAMRDADQRMKNAIYHSLSSRKLLLEKETERLKSRHPRILLERKKEILSRLDEKLQSAEKQLVTARKNQLLLLTEKCEALSPLKKLVGGYGYVSQNGFPVKSAHDLKTDDHFTVTFSDGSAEAVVQKMDI